MSVSPRNLKLIKHQYKLVGWGVNIHKCDVVADFFLAAFAKLVFGFQILTVILPLPVSIV